VKFLRAVNEARVRDLESLGDDYIAMICELFPESGSRLGFRKYDDQLGPNDPGTWKEFGKRSNELLAKVEALPEVAFAGDDWLDRRGLLSLLRTNHSDVVKRLSWSRDPQIHINEAIESIFTLLIRAGNRRKPVLPKIRARLRAIPDFLTAGAACIKLPDPLWQRLTEDTCSGGVEFFRDLEPELKRLAGPEADQVTVEVAAVIKAIERYESAINRKKRSKPNSFSVGREQFEFLIRERLGFDASLPEMTAAGEHLVAQMEYLIGKEAARLGARSADSLIEEARANWKPGKSLLELYKEQTFAIRDKVKEAELVGIPGKETLEVLPVPAFMRNHFPTAAYSPPGPFDRQQKGVFWVNDLGLTIDDPKKQLAERRQHFGLEFTAAHEAYPGHHLQFVVQYRHPSRIRRLCEHSIFYEGWTLWCERMMVDERIIDEPWARLIMLHDALWRACRIVVDCGLHSGQMSYDAACRYMMRNVGFTRARAEADVNWYTSSPTVPMSYLLGRLEMEKLHRKLVLADGWPLRKFNDWLLSFGAIPQRWIWRAALDDAAS